MRDLASLGNWIQPPKIASSILHLIVKWSYTISMLQKMLLLLTLFAACALAQPRVFELRTYHTYDGKLEALKANFRDHHLATFKRHGTESIGYWVPQDPVAGEEHTDLFTRACQQGSRREELGGIPEGSGVSQGSEGIREGRQDCFEGGVGISGFGGFFTVEIAASAYMFDIM
jgi:hypothetical protein